MWAKMLTWAQRLHNDERGAAMVEYAIITAVIAIVALSATQAVGLAVTRVFTNIVSALAAV